MAEKRTIKDIVSKADETAQQLSAEQASYDKSMEVLFQVRDKLRKQEQAETNLFSDEAAQTPDAVINKWSGFVQDPTNINPATGDLRPIMADGLSEETPINEPVVDIVDRLKLSVGNEKGSINYLKTKFEDAKVNSDGTMTVRKDGKWYAVDPDNGFAAVDAYKLTKRYLKGEITGEQYAAGYGQITKEFIADNFDLLDDATFLTSAIAATALTKNVSSLAKEAGAFAVTGGTASLLNTSLGRLMGTYEASPEEQMGEAGFEGLLNALGVAVLPAGASAVSAVKKTGQKTVADLMGKTTKAIEIAADKPVFKQMTEVFDHMGKQAKRLFGPAIESGQRRAHGVIEGVAGLFGSPAGISADDMANFLKDPDGFNKIYKEASNGSKTYREMEDYLLNKASDGVLNASKGMRSALSGHLDSMKGKINKVIPGVKLSQKATEKATGTWVGLLDDGIISVDDTGKFVLSDDQTMRTLLSSGKSKHVNLIESVESSSTNRKIFNEFLKQMNALEFKEIGGITGIDNIVATRVNMNQTFKKLVDDAYQNGTTVFADQLSSMRQAIMGGFDAGIIDTMEDALIKGKSKGALTLFERGAPKIGDIPVKDYYTKTLQEYDQISDLIAPLLKLQKESVRNRAKGVQQATSLLNKLRRASTTSLAARTAIGEVPTLPNQMSYDRAMHILAKHNKNLPGMMNDITNAMTAANFAPLWNKKFFQFGTAVTAGSTLTAIANDDLREEAVGVGAATAALISPKTSLTLLKSGLAGKNMLGSAAQLPKWSAQAAVKGMHAVRGVLNTVPRDVAEQLISTQEGQATLNGLMSKSLQNAAKINGVKLTIQNVQDFYQQQPEQ